MSCEEKARAVVASHLGIGEDKVTRDAHLIDDLGADSLDIVELVMELEEAFEIEIPDDEADKIDTFGQIVDFVDKALAGA